MTQRITLETLVGPANILRSQNVDCEDTINLYLEVTAPGHAKTGSYLASTPGLSPFAQFDDSPGLKLFYQDFRCFAIVGTTFGEVNVDGTTDAYGTVTAPSWSSLRPASIVGNGTAGGQLLICTGGDGFVFDLDAETLTLINTTNYPGTGFPVGNAGMCEFIDGYGIVQEFNTRSFYISALNDFTSWDALDVGERSEASDNLMGVIRNKREIFFPGSKTSESWYDNGDALFPFAPMPGVFIECGSVTSSFCRVMDTFAWVSLDERGFGCVNVMGDGYNPVRISTHAVEKDLQRDAAANQLDDCRLFAQQDRGHTFLWLYVPGLEWTWVFDFLTKTWHKRAMWNTTTSEWEPHRAVDHCFAFNRHLIADRSSGVIYELVLDQFYDSLAA